MKYYKEYNTNKLILINKSEINESINVSFDIVDEFTSEMYDLITLVAGRKLDFLDNYYLDNNNSFKKHITIRINNKLIAYIRIEQDEILNKLTNNELNLKNDITLSRGCVHPTYRGNLFYESFYLIALKYAITESKFNSISCFINDRMQYLTSRILKLGYKQINNNKTMIVPYAWNNYESTVIISFYQFTINNISYNNIEYLNKLDKLIQHSLLNEKSEYYKEILNLI